VRRGGPERFPLSKGGTRALRGGCCSLLSPLLTLLGRAAPVAVRNDSSVEFKKEHACMWGEWGRSRVRPVSVCAARRGVWGESRRAAFLRPRASFLSLSQWKKRTGTVRTTAATSQPDEPV
jgi:hypothetical protein